LRWDEDFDGDRQLIAIPPIHAHEIVVVSFEADESSSSNHTAPVSTGCTVSTTIRVVPRSAIQPIQASSVADDPWAYMPHEMWLGYRMVCTGVDPASVRDMFAVMGGFISPVVDRI
jgi:hypothetical protein